MNKQLVFFIVVFLVSLVGAYFLNTQLFSETSTSWPYKLSSAYLFHGGFSIILCIALLFLSKTEKWAHQIGFIYLFSFAFKLIAFSIVFRAQVVSLDSLPIKQSLSLLFPLFVALVFEVFFLRNIFQNIPPTKNE